MQQGSEEWFAKRAGAFTASRSKDLMARTKSGPSASRGNLITQLAVERLTGQCVETYSNAAMQRGTDLEPEARDAYIFDQCVSVEEVAFIDHPTIPMCGCSPDGLVDEDGMVEIKCPASMAKHFAALKSGAHAKEYHWQLQHQLMASGRKWVDAVSYDPRFPRGLQLAIKRIERDEDAISSLEIEIKKADAEINLVVEDMRAKTERQAAE